MRAEDFLSGNQKKQSAEDFLASTPKAEQFLDEPAQAPKRQPKQSTPDVDIDTSAQKLRQFDYVQSQVDSGRDIEDVKAELGGLEEPWVDPFIVGTGATGAGTKLGMSAGKKFLPAVGRSIFGAALPAAGMEYPIGTAADTLAEKDHPALAFLTSIGLGIASGLTVERLAEKGLLKLAGRAAQQFPNQAARKLPREVMERLKAEGPAEAWSPEVSQKMQGKMAKWENKAQQALGKQPAQVEPQPSKPKTPAQESAEIFKREDIDLERLRQSPKGQELLRRQLYESQPESLRRILEEPKPIEAARAQQPRMYEGQQVQKRGEISEDLAKFAARAKNGQRVPVTLHMHPATITGPLGGASAGVDWEALEEGEVKIDPKKALIGGLIGVAAGVGGPKAVKLAPQIATEWDQKFATPFLDWAKQTANHLITNERVRLVLGMDRSEELKTLMRDYTRDVETAWNKAAQIGQRLSEIAPSKLEQRRLMQVVRGGVTVNPEMARKAEEVQGLFTELRENMKALDLLRYSRFDDLTRAERATLRNITNGPDPNTIKGLDELKTYAASLGVDVPKTAKKGDLVGKIQERLDMARGRLNDYYHYGSAEEYAPLMYAKHEGLTRSEKKVIANEIKTLKKQAREAIPEQRDKIEDLAGTLEDVLGGKSKYAKAETYAKMDLGSTHHRMDLPPETQRLLGRIDEAPYPVAKAMGTQATDVRKAALFKAISENPEWVKAVDKGQRVPGNFKTISGKEWGALNGKAIRKDVLADLTEVNDIRNEFVRQWDKYLGWWKYGKVVLNPATHARNTMSNMILAYFGDVNPWDAKTYGKAARAIREGENNALYKEAADWGLYNNTFYSAEINKLRDDLDSVRDAPAMKSWVRKAFSLPADLYQGNEKFFKTAVFIKARQAGASVDEAARKAEKYLFNYADIPPWVKHMKRWVSPFLTFTYKALPRVGEMAIRKPWKLGAIASTMYGLEEFSKATLGYSDEEAQKKRFLLPEWQQRKTPPLFGPHAHVLMPFRDKWGNDLYWDTAYILPYGTAAEEWGQSKLPFRDLLPNNPLLDILTKLQTNVDPFTGREIANPEIDTLTEFYGAHLESAWRDIVPSMAPGGYSWNKLKTGFNNLFREKPVRDWADRPIELQHALLNTMLGIKLSPANYKKLKQREKYVREQIARSASKELGRLKGQYRRNELSQEEYQREAEDIMSRRREILRGRSENY